MLTTAKQTETGWAPEATKDYLLSLEGSTYSRLARELGVSRRTLLRWKRTHLSANPLLKRSYEKNSRKRLDCYQAFVLITISYFSKGLSPQEVKQEIKTASSMGGFLSRQKLEDYLNS
jgi:transposase-like protein